MAELTRREFFDKGAMACIGVLGGAGVVLVGGASSDQCVPDSVVPGLAGAPVYRCTFPLEDDAPHLCGEPARYQVKMGGVYNLLLCEAHKKVWYDVGLPSAGRGNDRK